MRGSHGAGRSEWKHDYREKTEVSMAQATFAVSLGVDYISVDPIFATNTQKDVSSPVGLEYLEYVVEL